MAQNGFRFKFLSVMFFIYYMKCLKVISFANELQTIPMISLAQTWANIKAELLLLHSLHLSSGVKESQAIADDIYRC